MRVILSVNSDTKPVLALQPINPIAELGYFYHIKQFSREPNLTRKRSTFELYDGDTNIVVVRAKKSKSFSKITEIEIGTLD